MSDRDLASIRAELNAYRRELRDEEIRRGKRRPRTQRETAIWSEGLRERFGIGDDEETAPSGETS